jgi:hypothetical protein
MRSALLLSLAGFLSLPAGLASAEVVKLRTGETIKGRVVAERTNENILVVEDYLLGGFARSPGRRRQARRDAHQGELGMGLGDTLVRVLIVTA